MKRKFFFKVHAPALINEITECALGVNREALRIPIQIFKSHLAKIAERCSEINDPVLNKIMCDMAMFEEADPYSKDYKPVMIKKVNAEYNKLKRKKEKAA